jgi:hypothetical protein
MPGKQKMTGYIGANRRRCIVWTWWKHYERKRGVSCMNIQPDFEELLRLLEKHDVDYMIVGGYAVAFHGHPRFTKDIDIFFSADKDNVERIKEALHEFGFNRQSLSIEMFMDPKNVISFGEVPVRVDFLSEIDGVPYAEARKNRIRGRYGDVEVNFIGRLDLIANKLSTKRTRDKGDAEELM